MIKVTMYVDDPMIPESFLSLARENLWSTLRGALLHQLECKMRAICQRKGDENKEHTDAYLAHCDHEIALIEDILSTINLEIVDENTDERARAGRLMLNQSAAYRASQEARQKRVEEEHELKKADEL